MAQTYKQLRQKKESWTPDDLCPICKKSFDSEACVHNHAQVQGRLAEDILFLAIDERLRHHGLLKNLS